MVLVADAGLLPHYRFFLLLMHDVCFVPGKNFEKEEKSEIRVAIVEKV
jgi:hypothetical protein